MVRPTWRGTLFRVAGDTATMVRKASGTVHSAGCATTAPAQPDGARPTITLMTAVADVAPPTTIPATAPGAVSPRHQMPRSSNGQNVEAATAKASSTAWATASPEDSRV